MQDKIREALYQHKGVILYLLFGGFTTAINIITFFFCYEIFGISNIASNVIAWIFAVTFAFITNKIWVFESKSFKKNILISEACKFTTCRIGTGLLDLAIMYIGVNLLNGPAIILKIASNIVVIILNYVASKLVIFKKHEKGDNKNTKDKTKKICEE